MFDQKQGDEDVSPKELIESFKLNLYQDEIYVFTPKGDLKILPKGATAIDFAFEIHSDVGFHTLGAKVNGRIVPLNTILRSGDQVEVITSKKQTPNFDWEKFAITHKAKSHIRRYIKEEERKLTEQGKELWDKKVKKIKLHINDDELMKFVHTKRYDNLQEFYLAIKKEVIDIDVVLTERTDGDRLGAGTELDEVAGELADLDDLARPPFRRALVAGFDELVDRLRVGALLQRLDELVLGQRRQILGALDRLLVCRRSAGRRRQQRDPHDHQLAVLASVPALDVAAQPQRIEIQLPAPDDELVPRSRRDGVPTLGRVDGDSQSGPNPPSPDGRCSPIRWYPAPPRPPPGLAFAGASAPGGGPEGELVSRVYWPKIGTRPGSWLWSHRPPG